MTIFAYITVRITIFKLKISEKIRLFMVVNDMIATLIIVLDPCRDLTVINYCSWQSE